MTDVHGYAAPAVFYAVVTRKANLLKLMISKYPRAANTWFSGRCRLNVKDVVLVLRDEKVLGVLLVVLKHTETRGRLEIAAVEVMERGVWVRAAARSEGGCGGCQ